MNNNFTICLLCTEDYKHIASKLISSCLEFGYTCHVYEIPTNNDYCEVCKMKVGFWKKAIEEFGTVLWLDADARIINPIPDAWFNGVTLARYVPKEQDELRTVSYEATNTGEMFTVNQKYYLGGFGILNETMLPIIEKTLEYVEHSWDDEITFNVVKEKYPELMPEYKEIPFHVRWTAENNEALKRDGSPHIVKGWTDNENSIIQYDEMHSWNTKRTLGDKPTPLVYNKKGAKIFHGKYDTNIVNNKMFCLYFKYFFDNEILTKIFDAMQGQVTDLEKYSDYKKISNDAFIMGNWYFNITSNEHSPLDVDVRIIKKCTPFFKEWKSWFPLKD